MIRTKLLKAAQVVLDITDYSKPIAKGANEEGAATAYWSFVGSTK